MAREGVRRRCVKIDDAFGIARTDGNLVHIHVRRVQEPTALGDRQHGQRVRHGFGANRGALERINGDIDLRAVAKAHLLADVEHRALVHLTLADDDAALDVDLAQLMAHGINGGLVGGLLVAPPTQSRRGDGGGLRHTRDLKHQDAVEPAHDVMALDAVYHRRSPNLGKQRKISPTAARSGSSAAVRTRYRPHGWRLSAARMASSVVSCVIKITAVGAPGLGLRVDARQGPAGTPLHDALERDAALAHAAGDGGHGRRAVEHGQAHIVGALVLAELGALDRA